MARRADANLGGRTGLPLQVMAAMFTESLGATREAGSMSGSDDREPPPTRRPASDVRRRVPVAPAARPFAPLHLDSHHDLLRHQAEIAARVEAEPRLSVMLLINPVLAFEELGVTMSHEIAHHVLHTIQHPREVRTRRDELEEKLKKALGEPARPTEAPWNAHLLFELCKLAPLVIGDHAPAYTPPLGEEESKPLQSLRPPGTRRYPQPRLLPPRSRVSSVPFSQALRRIDLDAPVPWLPHARTPPPEIPLEELWFYKDQDPRVHDALELGLIQRRAFPIRSPDAFRRILAGEKGNAFLLWVDRMSLKAEPRR